MTPTDARTKWLARELAEVRGQLRRMGKRVEVYKRMQIRLLALLQNEQITVSTLRAELEFARDEIERLRGER